jgi:hypothetical protein
MSLLNDISWVLYQMANTQQIRLNSTTTYKGISFNYANTTKAASHDHTLYGIVNIYFSFVTNLI